MAIASPVTCATVIASLRLATMIGSVAILSDVHGVLPALDAVLAEPDVRSADVIALTGDITAGPQPVEVLERLLDLGDRALWLRGNADREMVEISRGISDAPDPISAWAARQIPEHYIEFLAGLPHVLTRTVRGFGEVTFCHATPRDDEEVVLVDSRLERWTEVFAGVRESVRTIVCGHTHMPFTRLVYGRQVINPGSVGMPYGRPGAHWALLDDGAAALRHTAFDLDDACHRISSESSFEDAAEWAACYVRAEVTDTEALTTFAPRDGR